MLNAFYWMSVVLWIIIFGFWIFFLINKNREEMVLFSDFMAIVCIFTNAVKLVENKHPIINLIFITILIICLIISLTTNYYRHR